MVHRLFSSRGWPKLWTGFLGLLAMLSTIAACNEQQQRQVGVMPGSSGARDEILVVANDSTWQGPVGDSIRKYFQASYLMLPQPEPIFRLQQTDYTKFKDLFKKYRNVLFLGVLNQANPTTEHIKSMLNDDQRQKAMNNEGFYSFVKRDRWAKPQLLCYLFAPDRKTLEQIVNKNHQRYVDLFQNEELPKYKTLAYFKGKSEELTKRVKEKFNLMLKIPDTYKKAMDKKNFIWLRHDEKKSIVNIMISKKPYNEQGLALDNRGIQWRNRLGKKYIESSSEGSFMMTDTVLDPVSKKIELNGYPVYENRGLWRMANDFMGGPFLNYYLLDRKNKQKLLIEAFVYAPSKNKKKFMRKLEAIFSTFSIPGWNPKVVSNQGA